LHKHSASRAFVKFGGFFLRRHGDKPSENMLTLLALSFQLGCGELMGFLSRIE
jgi:hypothetical protein